jgi:hypothetical protein
MTARAMVAGVAVVLAATMTATALARGTASDPKALVLQRADVPTGARQVLKYADRNAQSRSYFVTYRVKGRSQMLDVTSWAIVAPRQVASTMFHQQVADLAGEQKIALPRYGTQVAVLAREDNEGQLWVLRGGTVWGITVNTAGVGNWGLITKAESVAQLKRYAAKQMKRVGNG